MTDTVATGFRLTVRSLLYLQSRNDFGCKDEKCTCVRHLTLDLPDPDGQLLPRVRHISRIEGMINVGCKFGPDDLAFDQWRDLLIVASERQWIRSKVQEYREELDKRDKEIEAAHKAMREVTKQSAGAGAGGSSLFGPKATAGLRRR